MLTIVGAGEIAHFQFLTAIIVSYTRLRNFVPSGSCAFMIICDDLTVLFFLLSLSKSFPKLPKYQPDSGSTVSGHAFYDGA